MSEDLRYPLHWPKGYARTRKGMQERSRFRCTAANARDELLEVLRKIGGRQVKLSSNVPLQRTGLPYAVANSEPADTGIAVYFLLNGFEYVLVCDRWNKVKDNMWAIKVLVDGLRLSGINIERSLLGFRLSEAPQLALARGTDESRI
jgi:hypothetical protein